MVKYGSCACAPAMMYMLCTCGLGSVHMSQHASTRSPTKEYRAIHGLVHSPPTRHPRGGVCWSGMVQAQPSCWHATTLRHNMHIMTRPRLQTLRTTPGSTRMTQQQHRSARGPHATQSSANKKAFAAATCKLKSSGVGGWAGASHWTGATRRRAAHAAAPAPSLLVLGTGPTAPTASPCPLIHLWRRERPVRCCRFGKQGRG